jgi:ribosomal protein L11 methyltransferase
MTVVLSVEGPEVALAPLSEHLWVYDGVVAVEEVIRDERLLAVRVYSEQADTAARIRAELPQTVTTQDPTTVTEADWANAWKQYWHVTPVSPRLTICPSWEPYTPSRPQERVITLDPGQAFGTGAHETTRLMLNAMDALAEDYSQQSVLDVGTGSGILAIAAGLLGSRNILAIDTDPVAVTVTQQNAELNGITMAVTDTPLGDLCHTRYDVVLANILGVVLLDLLPELVLRVEASGTLLLSGLIERDIAPLTQAMTEHGLTVATPRQEGPWFLLQGEKR